MYYSVVVFLDGYDEIPLPECGQILQHGMNAFTVSTSDIDGFLGKILSGGGRVTACTSLDSEDTIELMNYEQFVTEVAQSNEELRILFGAQVLGQGSETDPASSSEIPEAEPIGGDIFGHSPKSPSDPGTD